MFLTRKFTLVIEWFMVAEMISNIYYELGLFNFPSAKLD